MNENKRLAKTIAPVVVAFCLIAYYAVGGIVLLKFELPAIIKIIAILISILVTIVIIMVLAERIKEIKKGEDDDLSKY